MLDLISLIIITTALFSWFNSKFLKMVPGIGVMVIGLLISMTLISLEQYYGDNFIFINSVKGVVGEIDFNHLVLNGLLGILLFSAAIHIQVSDLLRHKYIIILMASVGLILSVILVGLGVWLLGALIGVHIPLVYAFLFGALISPTDPIAVLAIFRSVGAPKSLEIKLTGESLFNDGLAIVIFLILLGISQGVEFSFVSAFGLFIQEVFGGVIVGLVLGYTSNKMIASIDDFTVEILITIALVFSLYIVSSGLHVSNPIAAVVAGLLLGNHGKKFSMKEKTIKHLDDFWHLIDESLNTILFVILGLEVLVISFSLPAIYIGVSSILIVIFSRYFAISLIVNPLKKFQKFTPGVIHILTWAGLRGGISVALALSLPESDYRDIILVSTYIVVSFSIIVQGLSLSKLIKRY